MRPLIIAASLSLLLPFSAQAETPAPAASGFPAAPAAPATPTAPATPPAAPLHAPKLLEPHLHVQAATHAAHPRVALTFDACMGKADERILSTLVREKVPATIFVTARWLKYNPQAIAVFLQNPDLFDVEDHGENHVPAIGVPMSVYGIATAGSPQAVAREVAGGADAMRAAGLPQPHWFRGATAKYDNASIREIRLMGYRVAGYSVNGDEGSLLGAAMAEKRIAAARDGDVVIAHINQPTHAAGEGVAKAILALKAKGVQFVRLSDVDANGDGDTTRALPGLQGL